MSTIQGLPKSVDLSPLIELCLLLVDKHAKNPTSPDADEAQRLLNGSVKTIQDLMLSAYEHRDPKPETLVDLREIENRVREFLQTDLKPAMAVMTTTSRRPRTESQPATPTPAGAAPIYSASKSAEEFKNFLASTRNRRPALPHLNENPEATKVEGVQVFRPKVKAKFKSSMDLLNEPEKPRSSRARDLGQRLLARIRSKTGTKILLYLFLGYVVASIWIMMEFKTKSEQDAVAPPAETPVAETEGKLPENPARAEPKEEIRQENWVNLATIRSSKIRPEILLFERQVELLEDRLNVHFGITKAVRSPEKMKGTVILVTRGPSGIFAHPEGALAIDERGIGLKPSAGIRFNIKIGRIIEASLAGTGTSQVEVYVFNDYNRLIGHEVLRATSLK